MGTIIDCYQEIKNLLKSTPRGIKRRIKGGKLNSMIVYDKINKEVSYVINIIVNKNVKLPKCKEIKYKITDFELSIVSKEDYADIFFYFVEDLFYYIYDDVDNIIILDKICYTVNRWKYFFCNKVLEKLSVEKEIGLWGELETLKRLLIHNSEEILYMWNGPLKYKHDFTLNGIDIETKSILLSDKSKKIIHINSGEQLYSRNTLILNVNILEESLEGYTLLELVNDISSILSVKGKKYFYEMLCNVGYAPVYGERRRCNVIENNYYHVNNTFPRYLPKEGIVRLNYDIDIEDIESYKMNFDYKV